MLLSIKNICVYYGRAMALDDVSMDIDDGSVVGIIGANGAGKSTLLRAVSGMTPIAAGRIRFQDQDISGRAVQDIVKAGIVQVPEGRHLFPYLSVLNNLRLGASLRRDKPEVEHDMADIFERFPVLHARRKQKAGTLSGGEQQMLAIARGLMSRPKLLLLDEPSIGLAPIIVKKVGEIIKDINRQGITVLLVEQNVPLALGVARHGYALQVGRVVLEGDIETLKSSDILKRAYLGG